MPEGQRIGSLHDLARTLEVGIVTLQQVARVLEHEGLLEVRRGPGGGYYGVRPDASALERGLHAYMRMNPASYDEALDMTSLLFNELATAAARCSDAGLRSRLAALGERLSACRTMADCGAFETEFQELLFQMVRRPLFEMLTRVTLQYSTAHAAPRLTVFEDDGRAWKEGRARIIAAILANDPQLTRFEANRQNRAVILAHLEGQE
ncbi:transcriptional regulator [Novosphingobium guangzhouense]|uniref:transcriptional regulator n=1 Tax=Novosphingobium guangzhouense TaxID=1850347 RepID=UPI001FE37A6E|nr:transcriptional regulator [Novosphingobium guangzhouense]